MYSISFLSCLLSYFLVALLEAHALSSYGRFHMTITSYSHQIAFSRSIHALLANAKGSQMKNKIMKWLKILDYKERKKLLIIIESLKLVWR